MKKLLLSALAICAFSFANAQEDDKSTEGGQTAKGSWLIEANTGNAMLGNTGFYYSTQDGVSAYNIGLDGGYFVMDNLAIKAGLGFGDSNSDVDGNTFSYRIGAKYYAMGKFPVTVDLTGASGDEVKIADETPMWLGLGGGYAWFVSNNISIEPGLRYNISLNDDYTDEGVFQFNIGFALHF